MEKISKWSLSVPVMEEKYPPFDFQAKHVRNYVCTVHLQPATTLVFTREAAQMFSVSTSD